MNQSQSRTATAPLSRRQTLEPHTSDERAPFCLAGGRGLLLVLALVLLAAVVVPAGSASAATFTAACSGTTGDPASLVAAINSANAAGGANVVQLGAGCTYTLTAVDNNWYGPNGLPAIASDDHDRGQWGDGRTQRRSRGRRISGCSSSARTSPNPNTDQLRLAWAWPIDLEDLTLSGGLAKGGDSDGGWRRRGDGWRDLQPGDGDHRRQHSHRAIRPKAARPETRRRRRRRWDRNRRGFRHHWCRRRLRCRQLRRWRWWGRRYQRQRWRWRRVRHRGRRLARPPAPRPARVAAR